MQLPPASQRHRNPATVDAPAGIRLRGWLIPIGVGLVLLPFRLALFLMEDIAPAFTTEVWAALTVPGSPTYHPFNAPILLFELVGNVVLLASSAGVALAFFFKHRRVPLIAVVFLGTAWLFYVIDYLASERLAAAQGLQSSGPMWDLLGATVLCAMLVPYFLLSQRVKKTFLR